MCRSGREADADALVRAQGYAMGKKIVYSLTPGRTSQSLSNAELAFAGFFSAVPTTFVAAPVERVKVLLQVSSIPSLS